MTETPALKPCEWLPIESAPRDGTPILIWQPNGERTHHMPTEALKAGECSYKMTDPRLQWFDDGRYAIGYWRPWGGWGNRNSATVTPTHWMPLPSAPVGSRSSDEAVGSTPPDSSQPQLQWHWPNEQQRSGRTRE